MYKSTTILRSAAMAVLLFVGLISAKAVNYQLTTHEVFGESRVISGTANISAGDNLLDNMPQVFWRAYTTYKFYSDAAMTQEITDAPSANATVYVDYVFNPPFVLSNEDGSNDVWHYFRGYTQSGKKSYVYYNTTSKHLQSNSSKGTGDNYQFAFFGDAFNLHFKVKSNIANPWMYWNKNSYDASLFGNNFVQPMERKSLGWQLYINTAAGNGLNVSPAAFGHPTNLNYILYMEDYNTDVTMYDVSRGNRPNHGFNSKNQLVQLISGDTYKHELWWYAFFATPTSIDNFNNNWKVIYKILMGYDNLNQRGSDIIKEKGTDLVPALPESAKLANTDETKYVYYYFKDAELKEMYMEGEEMPAEGNTTVYVLEDKAISTTWKTLCLPAGFNPALINMEVLEFTSLTTSVAPSGGYNFHLDFTPANEVVEDKPYLYRFVDAGETIVSIFNENLGSDYFNSFIGDGEAPIEVPQIDNAYPEVQVVMTGAFENVELTPQVEDEDPLYFYFSYNSVQEAYKFYPVKRNVTITPWKCYFYTVGVPEGSSVSFSMDDAVDGITAVSTDMGKNTSKGVYNLNGQLINTNGSTVGLPAGIYMVNGKKMIVK